MNLVDCIQGDAVWFKNRIGCVTSSRVAAVVKKRKRVKEGQAPEELACRYDLRMELIQELLTDKPSEHYVSRWMEEGKEKEPLARAEYEMLTDRPVDLVGYVYHDRIKMAGASPDGIVGGIGAVEFKCPRVSTHLQYLIDDVIPEIYIPQLLWQMACIPELEWVDFMSYCPELPEDFQRFLKRLPRNKEADALISAYEAEVELFNEEVQRDLSKLRETVKARLAYA